jgi:mono/diheme cytochrome c family protein
MRTLVLLACLSLPAFAADAATGATLFNNRCASCHVARAVGSKEKLKPVKGPPDLALLTRDDPFRFNAWLTDPKLRATRVSACDTTGLGAEALPDLHAYLRSQTVPVVSRSDRRLRQLEAGRQQRNQRLQEKKTKRTGGAR